MKSNRLPKYVFVVAGLTAMNLLILAIRNINDGDDVFNFLKSNLWSGFVPLLVAFLLDRFYDKLNAFFFWIGCAVWLLFYPNSPYMISDLIHDSLDSSMNSQQIVYDTLIIFGIAMLSVFYGFISLKIMYHLFSKRVNKNFARSAIIFSLLLSCLGFYMGREMASGIKFGNGYMYSSEMFMEPVQIIKDVWGVLFPIKEHIAAYEMMALFGVIQFMLLIMMRGVGNVLSDDLEEETK